MLNLLGPAASRVFLTLMLAVLLIGKFSAGFAAETQLEFHESKYPVALSFLLADLKYNKEKGVRICEVQQGIMSSFNQDNYIHDGHGVMSRNFYEEMKQFGLHTWAKYTDVNEAEIRRLIRNDPENWTMIKNEKKLKKDSRLKRLSSTPFQHAYL